MKAKHLKVKIKELKRIKRDIFLLSFVSPYLARVALPGNFLQIKIDSVILRRPFSVHKLRADTVYILFKVRGRGTKILSQIKKGEILDIIGPLGKGFNFHSPFTIHHSPILVAGGIGVAPLLFLAQRLKERQATSNEQRTTVLLGAKTKSEICCQREFINLGYKVCLATDDGSQGFAGSVTSLLKEILETPDFQPPTIIYACGPKEMFLEISQILGKYPKINCQVSFEQFMGCGLGVCCGCVIETKNGYKKVCKDGPVFDIRDIY